MNILFIVLGIILILILSFLLTSLKISVYLNTLETETVFVAKVYIFSFMRVFKITKHLKAEKKKLSQKVEFIINYLFKSKADPIDYAQKEIKKAKGVPKFVKNIDLTKMYIDELDLNVKLDFGSAAISAIASGAANGIVNMVLGKYEDNFKGPVNCNIVPGYIGDGVKAKIFVKVKMRVLELLKIFLKKA